MTKKVLATLKIILLVVVWVYAWGALSYAWIELPKWLLDR